MTTQSEELRRQARAVVDDDPEAALQRFDDALSAGDATAADLATALKDKAVTLARLGRIDEARTLFDQVIERHARAEDPQVRLAVDRALYNKAVSLNEAGSKNEAIRLYDEIANRNLGRSDMESRRSLAKSFLAKAQVIESQGTDEALAQAIPCYGLVRRVRGRSNDLDLMELAARSLLCEAFAVLATQRGFVQNFSWWSRRSLFKRMDAAIALLAASTQDTDKCLLLAARAVTMQAKLLAHFGYSKKAEKVSKAESVARRFGPVRAKRIVAFMEAEENLRKLAAFSGTQSMGVFLSG